MKRIFTRRLPLPPEIPVFFDNSQFLSLFLLLHYRPQRSCGQGYVFTAVFDSVHGGVSGRETPLPGRTPPTPAARENPPVPLPGRTHPCCQGEPPPRQGEPPLPGRTPAARENPPPRQGEPPPGYGQCAAGTHPSGMQSCSFFLSVFSFSVALFPSYFILSLFPSSLFYTKANKININKERFNNPENQALSDNSSVICL